VRVAASMGIKEIPVMLTFYNATSHTEVCGLAPPVAAVATAGSNSSVTPPKPPEIELPDPPQVEPPASGS